MTTPTTLGPRHAAFIPLRKSELIELLCSDSALPEDQREPFRTLCRRLVRWFHDEYQGHAERLKDTYAPFNPDADTQSLREPTAEEKQRRLDQFFEEIGWMMRRANFVQLGRDAINEAIKGATEWGLNMEIDEGVFERWALFARGEIMGKRTRPGWWPWSKPAEKEVPIYQRLVVVMKLKPHKRLGPAADTESIHVKAFKDIPRMDLEMLLPGARVQLSRLDAGLIGVPLLTGVGITLWTFLKPILVPLLSAYLTKELAEAVGATEQQQRGAGFAGLLFGLTVVAFAYSYRTWFSYIHRKTSYSLKLTESLYYQNLVNNAGVLSWLTDEVEEQESREALLSYFYLWRHAGPDGLTQQELDQGIERYLRERARIDTDFEVDDAVAKVERLGLVTRNGDRYFARPLADALTLLRERG